MRFVNKLRKSMSLVGSTPPPEGQSYYSAPRAHVHAHTHTQERTHAWEFGPNALCLSRQSSWNPDAGGVFPTRSPALGPFPHLPRSWRASRPAQGLSGRSGDLPSSEHVTLGRRMGRLGVAWGCWGEESRFWTNRAAGGPLSCCREEGGALCCSRAGQVPLADAGVERAGPSAHLGLRRPVDQLPPHQPPRWVA